MNNLQSLSAIQEEKDPITFNTEGYECCYEMSNVIVKK